MRAVGFWKCLGASLVLTIGVGCGGGGGGDTGSGGGGSSATTPPPENLGRGVTVGAPNAANVRVPFAGDTPQLTLTGKVTGKFDSLNGMTVYVIVEDPSGTFSTAENMQLTVGASSADYRLVLTGSPLKSAVPLSGKLRINVCLDTACKSRLDGTPLTVPFELNVLDPLTLSRSEITVEVPFGTVPQPETVDVKWSGFSRGWLSQINNVPGSADARDMPINVLGEGTPLNTQPQFHVLFAPEAPGTYVKQVQVSTAVVPLAEPKKYIRNVNVTYRVLPNPALDAFFFPAQQSFQRSRSLEQHLHSYKVTTNTGITATLLGIEYLSWAGTKGPYQSWWEASLSAARTCTGTVVADATCLTPGVYTAQARYRLTSASGPRDVLYPISMTVSQ